MTVGGLPGEGGDGFAEFSPQELAEALLRAGEGLEVVSLEVQDPSGRVLVEAVRLKVEYDHDWDRSGGYRWVKIVGRLEPRNL